MVVDKISLPLNEKRHEVANEKIERLEQAEQALANRLRGDAPELEDDYGHGLVDGLEGEE